jgi:threonine/homoserine/homoserine lactone efflux protein
LIFSDWLSISIVCLIGAMSPGPSLLIVSYQTTSFGLKNGIVFSFSHGLGIFLYAFVTAIGIGLLITKSPILYNGIQIVGIVFLIYLSFQMLTFKMETPALENKKEIYKNPFLVGITASIVNPKIILFFTSIFSQFIKPEMIFIEKIYIAFLASIIDITWYILVSFFIQHSLSKYIKNNISVFMKIIGLVLALTTIILMKNLL